MKIQIQLPLHRMGSSQISEMASKLRHAGFRMAARELKEQSGVA